MTTRTTQEPRWPTQTNADNSAARSQVRSLEFAPESNRAGGMHAVAMSQTKIAFPDDGYPHSGPNSNTDWLNRRPTDYKQRDDGGYKQEQFEFANDADLAMHQLKKYRQRKHVGDKHERRVREELERREWEVNDWGQGLLGPTARAALKSGTHEMRWAPDFFVARGNHTLFVDAKGKMPASHYRDSYFVESAAVEAHVKLILSLGVSVFYVFHDLKAINAVDAKRHGHIRKGRKGGSGTPLYSIPIAEGRPFDEVFRGAAQESGRWRDAA